MKNTKPLAKLLSAVLFLALCLYSGNVSAQTNADGSTMKDCCMMKHGKMMVMQNGKAMPMTKDMKMKNGATCMVNGECLMSDGKKIMMKEGQCMDMNGNMDNCPMMKTTQKTTTMKAKTQSVAMTYKCPMHSEVTSDKPGKCSKCGMDLVENK